MHRLATFAALLATLLASVALGFAAMQLALSFRPPPAETVVLAPQTPAANPPTPEIEAPRPWPTLFGRFQPVPPEPPKPPEPPAPPTPPVASLGYHLRGVFSKGEDSWAILSHPSGDRIFRVGDILAEGITVSAIDAAGVWVSSGRGRELIGFPE